MIDSEVKSIIHELADVGSSAVAAGLVLASGGNLSARLPGRDSFVITRSGAWLDRLEESDFSELALSGEVLGGSPHPSSEWKLHQRSYQQRPDVNAVIHVHPQYAVLVDALGIGVRLISLDHAFYVKSIGTTPFYPNGSDALAESAAAQAADHDCIIMSHHGCSTLGDSIEMAYRRALNLEEAAMATYRALAVGNTTVEFPREDFAALHHA